MKKKYAIARANELRELLKHENELINSRLNWMVLYETLLLSAFATILKGEKCIPSIQPKLILETISFVGLSISFSIIYSLIIANNAINNLLKHYENIRAICQFKRGFEPVIMGYSIKHQSSKIFLPWFFVPVLFFVFWAFLLGYIICIY